MRKQIIWACLLLGGGGAPPSLWAQQVQGVTRPFVAVVEQRTSRWAELFRMEDTARLTPLDLRHFFPEEEALTVSRVWDGTHFFEVMDFTGTTRPEEGMPHPLQRVRHGRGVDFYYADPQQNHALVWAAADAQEWQEHTALLVPRGGHWLLPHSPLPTADQVREWGRAVETNTAERTRVVWDGLTVEYHRGTGVRTERWGQNDSVRRIRYAALPTGDYFLAELEERGRETGANGVCWTGYRRVEWGAPRVDTGAAAVANWLAARGWSNGINGPYSQAKTAWDGGGGSPSEGPLGTSSPWQTWVAVDASGNGRLVARGPLLGVDAEVFVADATGRVVWTHRGPWSGSLDLTDLPGAHVYTVWIQQGGQRHATRWVRT